MRRQVEIVLRLAVALGLTAWAWGQGGGQAGRGAPPQTTGAGLYNYDTAANAGMPAPDAKPAETRQKVTIDGEVLAYTARAGYLPLRNATSGQAEAYMFFTSYAKDAASDPSKRPVMFFFGGAPGVAAAWQELGGFGPKRVIGTGDGTPGNTSYGWTDNPDTLLGSADLVFVNPVGTGYSRPSAPGRGPSFWSTAGDTTSMGEFVRAYLNTYDRRTSPLFLAGEDLGTGRAAGVAAYLQDHQIPVTGVILLSMTLAADAVAGDGQYITLLPSLVLAAWSHKKLSPDLLALGPAELAEQARQFASRAYLHALYEGDRMPPGEQAKVAAELARLTGLPTAFIINNNLRIPLDRFSAELLRKEHQALSPSDARVTGFVPAAGGRGRGFGGFGGGAPATALDYRQSFISGPFLAAYESYLRRELAFSSGLGMFYLVGGGVGTYTSTGSDDASLSSAFVRNPRLRLFIGVCFFDLGAPFYATEFTLAQLAVSPDVRARNITVSHFEAGQMPYFDVGARSKLKSDLTRFIAGALPPTRPAAGEPKEN
jgi:carboxypeptidase C (cathepsin A)